MNSRKEDVSDPPSWIKINKNKTRRSSATIAAQFSSVFLLGRLVKLLERQFNRVAGRSLLRRVLYAGSARKYTMTMRIEAGPLPTRVPERVQPLRPLPLPLSALSRPLYSTLSIFRGALDIENTCKLGTIRLGSIVLGTPYWPSSFRRCQYLAFQRNMSGVRLYQSREIIRIPTVTLDSFN